MKEILIPLNFTTTPTVYDTKQSFSTSDEASGVLTFTTTADVAGTVASLTIRNASENANRKTVIVERLDVNSSPFSYAVKMPLPFGNYEGTLLLKKNLIVVASATFLFGVNSSLSAEVLPKLVEAYSLDALVEEVETEVSNLKDAYNLTVSETVKGVKKTESTLQASENVRYLNEDTRKNNNSLWKAQAEAFALAEENRVIEFNDLVDSAVIEQVVTQEVAEKYQEIVSLNAQEMVSFRQQLADITHTVVYNLLFEGFLFDGSDESAKLQSLLDLHLGESITLVLPQNKTLRFSNVMYAGTLNIIGNWCTLTGSGYLFLNKENQTMRLYVENVKVTGDVGLCNLEVTNGNVGTKINVKNVVATAFNRIATFIKAKATDFLNCENVELYNYDIFMDVQSDVLSGDRTNTQLHLKNINVRNTHFGLLLSGVDKITATGLDISGCSTGIIFKSYVARGLFLNYHCEYFGTYVTGAAYDGCGIYVQGRANQNIKFQESSIMLPGESSSHGIFMSNSTYVDNYINQLIFDDCYVPFDVSLQANYKAMNLCEGFEWYGDFPYTNLSAKLNTSLYNKVLLGVVKPALSNHSSRNLLNKNELLQVSDFAVTEGSGTVTVATVNGETVFTNTSGNDVGYSLTFNPPSIGWYTLIFNGHTGSNKLYIAQLTDPYKTFYESVCDKKGDFQTNRVIFYIDDRSAPIKVKFDILNNSVVTLSEIGLYKGLKETY